jgi:hypothetical protein
MTCNEIIQIRYSLTEYIDKCSNLGYATKIDVNKYSKLIVGLSSIGNQIIKILITICTDVSTYHFQITNAQSLEKD